MTDSKHCMNCETTESTVFRSLKDKKWEEAENNNLTKEKWVKGGKLCYICYMNFVENLLQRLQREAKRVRISSGEVEVTARKEVDVTYKDVGTTMEDMEEASMIDLVGTIEAMTRIFYEKEHVKKEGPIYSYEELREVFQTNKCLENFLDQLYLVARPLERGEKIIDRTSNEGLDTLANLGVTTTSRAVDKRKKRVADAHEKYVEDSFLKNSGNAFVLNIDDYHNIHIPQQADSTNTSHPAHMATIIANPCPVSAIPRNGALNPRIIDAKLIMKHLDEWFIINLGIPYNERRLGHTELMQGYLSDHIIPVVADWPGQFFIRKAIVHQLFLNNEVVLPFVASFVPIMGPLHVSLNGCELVYKKNSFLFNDIYKGIFGKKKNLGKKPRPWRIDLILYLMRVAWLDISNVIYSKFGHTCKNLEFLYLTDLLNNLIPLVLDVYAAHHREGNWQAYEEVCMRCWFANHLASLSDCPVETVNSIIRRRTAKFFTASQWQKEARFIFQHRDDNIFRVFMKIYKARYLYPLTINSSDDNINSYKLPSLGYEITDRHLPRGFVTSRKPFINVLCDYLYCDCTNYTNCSNDGYLQDAIKSNVEAIKVSMMKDLGEKEFMDENVESADEDDSDAEDATGDIATVDNLLDQAKKNFFEL
ncbi:hypothetical protein C2G38_2178254 [Gigaspora rosea]|uniref:Uncharacterized protein n=1 Tax=Gigaspora rosea TaxID=44941 RepID=A0A397VGC3_9GLOM|nr:hypothetical protein C2G38_2178254 [Gigaspora rosea]